MDLGNRPTRQARQRYTLFFWLAALHPCINARLVFGCLDEDSLTRLTQMLGIFGCLYLLPPFRNVRCFNFFFLIHIAGSFTHSGPYLVNYRILKTYYNSKWSEQIVIYGYLLKKCSIYHLFSRCSCMNLYHSNQETYNIKVV